MRRVAFAALALAAVGLVTGSAAGSAKPSAQQLHCKYGSKYVVKVVHGHRKRVKVCKRKPKPPPAKPKADVELTMEPGPTQITVGNHVVYTFLVENKGPSPADVTIEADVPAGDTDVYGYGGSGENGSDCTANEESGAGHVSCHFGELAPESQDEPIGQNPYAFLTVSVEPSAAGDFITGAKVTTSAETVDPHPEDNEVARPFHVLPGPAAADLSVTISAAPEPATVPGGYAETLSVTNTGPTEATDIFVTLLLPQGAQVDELPPADLFSNLFIPSGPCPPYVYSFFATSLVCFDSVASGETRTKTIQVAPSIHSPSTLQTDAVVSSYTRDANLANNRASSTLAVAPFTPASGPDVRLSLLPPQRTEAGVITIPFRLANLGLEGLDGVSVDASVSPTLASPGLSLFTLNSATECATSDTTINCLLEELPSDSHTVGAISGAAAPGTYTATVTVTSKDLSAPITSTVTFEITPSPARR